MNARSIVRDVSADITSYTVSARIEQLFVNIHSESFSRQWKWARGTHADRLDYQAVIGDVLLRRADNELSCRAILAAP